MSPCRASETRPSSSGATDGAGAGLVPADPETTSVPDRLSRPLSPNERRVLALLQSGPRSRAELARLTGLTAQALTGIARSLDADGLVRTLAPVRGRVGQPSVPLALDPEGAAALGLAIGRRGGECALVDLAGGIVARRARAWRWPDPDEAERFAREAAAELAPHAPPGRLHGIGVSMPSELWQWHERLDAPRAALERWRGRDLVGALAAATGLPVRLGNDAASACGAELTWGGGAGFGDFAHFSIGFLVGGGLVIDGAVHAGRHGRGAAFGSLPVPDGDAGRDGPGGSPAGGGPARAGARTAQLIDEASVHVAETLLERAGHAPGPGGLTGPAGSGWHAAPAVIARWESRASAALATAVASVAAVVDLDRVVIDGPVPAEVRARLVAGTARALARLDTRGLVVPAVVEGRLGERGAVLGAARLALLERLLPARQPSTLARASTM